MGSRGMAATLIVKCAEISCTTYKTAFAQLMFLFIWNCHFFPLLYLVIYWVPSSPFSFGIVFYFSLLYLGANCGQGGPWFAYPG